MAWPQRLSRYFAACYDTVGLKEGLCTDEQCSLVLEWVSEHSLGLQWPHQYGSAHLCLAYHSAVFQSLSGFHRTVQPMHGRR